MPTLSIHRIHILPAAAALSLALAGGCDSSSSVNCGPGTRLEGAECVLGEATLTCGAGTHAQADQCIADPDTPITCGVGTRLEGTACLPEKLPLELGNFQSPFTLVYELHKVGSHSDEVKIREDNLLLNCSYSFNVIDATRSSLRLLSPAEGLEHIIPGDERTPGCKHLGWDGNLVFTTHFGNARNPAYLSGWDITDPAAPIQLPVLQEPDTSYQGVDVSNHNIFVALHNQGLGVYTYTSSIVGFTRIGHVPGFTLAWGVAASDNRVVVADASGSVGVVDATDPAAPVLSGSIVTGGQPRGAVINGDFAYIAAGSAGLFVVDISDMANPTIAAHVDMPGTALRVAFSEDRVFVAAWNDTRAYDVSTPTAPRFIAAVRIPRDFDYAEDDRERPTHRTFGVAARGQDVFIAAWDHPFVYRLEPDRLAPNLRLNESSVRTDFGPVAVGSLKTISFPVTNQGTAPLTIAQNWITNPAFTVEPQEAVIAMNETLELQVTFNPTDTTVASGLLHIVSDDPMYPIRKAFLVGNPEGVSIGSPLPATTAQMVDGSIWSSETTLGSVLLLTYFGTFCPVCANHLPDTQERFWRTYGSAGLQVVALDPREGIDVMPQVMAYCENLQLTFPMGIEDGAPDSANTYRAIIANFQGPNPFPVDVIVDKQGIIRYATHEYDPDAMTEIIERLLAE